MSPISRALLKALLSLAHPKMFLLMLLPVAAAMGVWLVLGIAFWVPAVAWLDAELRGWDGLQWLLAYWPLTLVAGHVAWVLLLGLMVPVVIVTAILLVGIFAMPFMVAHVATRGYPDLLQQRGGSIAESAGNSFAAIGWFALLLLLSSPLWLFPPLWPLLSLGLLGYLNQRVFRYDALAEHATAAEMATIFRQDGWRLYALGVLIAVAGHIPVLGFFSPVYGGLVFIHYCLDRLRRLRSEPVAGEWSRIAA